jgi:hypothetical protein
MPEQDASAREVQHPEKVLDMVIRAGDDRRELWSQAKRRLIFQRRSRRRNGRPSWVGRRLRPRRCAAIISMPYRSRSSVSSGSLS